MRRAPVALFLFLSVGCSADPDPRVDPSSKTLSASAWQSEVALELKVGLNGCAVGDVDPLRPGNEVVAVAADGGVHLAWREAGAWRHERIASHPGELIQVAVGDLLPEAPGLEIVAVGNAEGRESERGAGVAVLIRRVGPRWVQETIFRDPRLVHGVCVVRGAVFLAGYSATAHRLTRTESGWRGVASTLPGPGRSIAALPDGAVVACKSGALVRLSADGKTQVLDRRDVGRARVGAHEGHVIAADDDGALTVIRGAPDAGLRGVERQRELLRASDKLRGAILADLDPDRAGLEAATAGYDGAVRILHADDGGGWSAQTVATDTGRFHHLAAGSLPGYPGVSLVGANLSGRLIVVRRAPAAVEHSARRVRLERLSAGVPWPRGIVFANGRLLVLARGRHRSVGGPVPSIDDRGGTLFEVDPTVTEPVRAGVPAGARVARNATVWAAPSGPFRLWDTSLPRQTDDTRTDRPYCTLAWDPRTQNLFVCGYSGIDLADGGFRKNATDSVLRYDTRVKRWFVVEQHDPRGIAIDAAAVVPNDRYPHHDPATSPAPHGWLNGPDGAVAAGRYLYVVAKDNSLMAQYDLASVARDPTAAPPPSRVVLRQRVALRTGGVLAVEGHCAVATWGKFLYVAFRTSSQVIRLPLDPDGDLVRPLRAEVIARFDPYDPATGTSPDITDLAFDPRGVLYVTAQKQGQVWRVGKPNPAAVYDARSGKGARPLIDLPRLTGRPSALPCNLTFDPQGRMLLCAGANDTPNAPRAGAVYRVRVN